MRIKNLTRNTIVAEKVEIAEDFFFRTRGLLGRDKIDEGFALIITRCKQIHTFFMRFPIDVLFVDRGNRVIKTISAMPPSRISGFFWDSHLVIELSAGVIKATQTQSQDLLFFEL